MFSQLITFDYSKSTTDEDAIFEYMDDFLDSLRGNGQILGRYWPCYKHDTYYYSAIVSTLEQDSLDKRYFHYYVNRSDERLTTHQITFNYKMLGEEQFNDSICSCKNPNAYIMYALFNSIGSPIVCADCFGSVPLYKLPTFANHDYYELLCWQYDFTCCDNLQMRCTTLEKGATREISNLKSNLSKWGFYCRDILTYLTQRPIYYYLYKYNARSYKQECNRKCPSCGRDWLLTEDWHDTFAFRCDYCHLVSNFSWNLINHR